MTALRWIFFIPLGYLVGSLLSLPIQLLIRLGGWWWGGGADGAWIVFVKSFTLSYFQILSMAWVAPPTLRPTNFRILVSLLFGIYLTIYVLGMSALLSGQPGVLDGKAVPAWEVWTGFAATLTGYVVAVFGDKNSIPALLEDAKGVHPYNSYSHE